MYVHAHTKVEFSTVCSNTVHAKTPVEPLEPLGK